MGAVPSPAALAFSALLLLLSSLLRPAAASSQPLHLGLAPVGPSPDDWSSASHDQGSLVLVFRANASTACATQCILVVTSRPCLAGAAALVAAGAAPSSSAAAGQLDGFHTVLLPPAAAAGTSVELSVECSSSRAAADCQATPQAVMLWRGAACSGAMPDTPQPPPHALLSSTTSPRNQSVALLNYGRAVLQVAPAPAEAAGEEGTSLPGAGMADQEAGGDAMEVMVQPAPAASTMEEECGSTTDLIATLLLAAWLVVCPALPRLAHNMLLR